MNHKMLACLSESHFKDFLLSEITFFLVFESMQNCVKRIIEWVQRKRNQFTRSKEYNSKIKIFFAGNSGIIEITSCDQLHRKKLPEIIGGAWWRSEMTSDHLQESLGDLVIRVGALLILMPKPEAQKPKTFRIAAVYAQNFSG